MQALTAALATSSAFGMNSTATMKLTSYNIEEGSVTTSGLSSGGFMAVQMHVAFSSLIHGNSAFAAGPYYCAMGSMTTATNQCMYAMMGGPNVEKCVQYTNTQAAAGKIDDPKNMANHKVYIFSGVLDTVVYPEVAEALHEYYSFYVDNEPYANFDLEANHCIPTLDYGNTCELKKSPYLGKCNWDGAGESMVNLYGSSLKRGTAVSSHLYKFDQTEFFSGTKTSLADFGFIYIPTACANGESCKLHMSFHGCLQDYDNIGDVYAAHAGFNEWAEANNIIVVYPYAEANAMLSNPNACWDWWGYTDANYAIQSGVQMQFAKKILNRLMGV